MVSVISVGSMQVPRLAKKSALGHLAPYHHHTTTPQYQDNGKKKVSDTGNRTRALPALF
jgi:hypothetical protein